MNDFEKRLADVTGAIHIAMPDTELMLRRDQKSPENGRFYLQIRHWRPDTNTGKLGWGYGGKAYLSEHMIDEEIVRTAFGLLRAYWEHEAREAFLWHGRRVFGPHISLDALWDAADHLEHRP